MSYREQDRRVTVEMDIDDWHTLLCALGWFAAHQKTVFGDVYFWAVIGVVNRLNEGNPRFTQYEIPPEYRK